MAERGYLLTESDVLVLKELIADFKRTKKPQKSSYRESESDLLPPEVYTAWVPGEGIPAISAEIGTETGTGTGTGAGYNDTVSSAVCDIYRKDSNDILRYTGLTRPVYNLSATAVPGNRWILASRDKWGTWYDAGMVGDSSGSGSGSLIVSEFGGAVSVPDVGQIYFLYSDGFRITDLGGGVATVSLPRRGIDVSELDGVPNVTAVTALRFSSSNGLAVTTPGAGQATISGIEATGATWGIVTTNSQAWRGEKAFADNIHLNDIASNYIYLSSDKRSFIEEITGGSVNTVSIRTDLTAGTNTWMSISLVPAASPASHKVLFSAGSASIYPVVLSMETSSGVFADGVTGTGGGGDVIKGGVVTGLGGGPSLIDGGTW